MYPQNFENVSKVSHVLRHHLALHHHVIYIDLNTPTQLWFKHLSHHLLIGGSRIFQVKRHHFVMEISSGSDESCLFLNILGLVVFDGILERHLRSSSENGLQWNLPSNLFKA